MERREGARAYVTGARNAFAKVFRCSPVSSSLVPTKSAGEEAGEHQGAAIRTSALAALRSLTGANVGWVEQSKNPSRNEREARLERSRATKSQATAGEGGALAV